jgi:hypothetical protein
MLARAALAQRGQAVQPQNAAAPWPNIAPPLTHTIRIPPLAIMFSPFARW